MKLHMFVHAFYVENDPSSESANGISEVTEKNVFLWLPEDHSIKLLKNV